MKYIITIAFIIYAAASNAQELNKSINKDSLLNAKIKDLPKELRLEMLKQYQSGSEQEKEFLLFIVSMSRSSKKLLMRNIDSNYEKVWLLKSEYTKLVPRNNVISIEFVPADPNFNIKASIDLRISKTENKEISVLQDWNMAYDSKKLDTMLKTINWNLGTLKTIKKLLDDADCISIENGKQATIGFARSGMGEYSYILFNNDLDDKQVKQYNDGCNYIFYKKDIVLEYEGGAAGPQCFPDR